MLLGFCQDLQKEKHGRSIALNGVRHLRTRALPNIGPIRNPEFRVDLSRIRVADGGDIRVSSSSDPNADAGKQLAWKVLELYIIMGSFHS